MVEDRRRELLVGKLLENLAGWTRGMTANDNYKGWNQQLNGAICLINGK
jgi:hypothetical protein